MDQSNVLGIQGMDVGAGHSMSVSPVCQFPHRCTVSIKDFAGRALDRRLGRASRFGELDFGHGMNRNG